MRKLCSTGLFYGFTPEETAFLCREMNARYLTLDKGEFLFHQGTTPEFFALVLEGDLLNIRYDDEGNSTPLFLISAGQIASALSVFCTTPYPYSAAARGHTSLLLMDTLPLLPPEDPLMFTIRQRILEAAARQERLMAETLLMMHLPTLRQRILFFLGSSEWQHGGAWFSIPFTREEMAAFLGCNRSALSKELGKMRRDGIIEYEGSRFRLLPAKEG